MRLPSLRSRGPSKARVAGEPEGPRPPLLWIAAERQVWRRSSSSTQGERSPAGRIHAVFGKTDHTLCSLSAHELATFPYRDFTDGSLERCDICRVRGAQLLH